MKPAYKPVLCVVSSHPIKGASGVPTGFFLAELTHPLKVLEDAGIKTTIASIRGGQPPVDGFDLSDPVNAWYWNETDFQQRLATTPALSELKGADYSAGVAQIAIAWAIAKGTLPLVGATKVHHVLDAACASDIQLRDEEIILLEQLAAETRVDTRGAWEKPMV